MSETVNLRRARKQRRRAEKERTAAENRLTHGTPAAEREARRRAVALDEKRLVAHRREPDAQS